MKDEIVCQIHQNKSNGQFTLVPQKKSLSEEMEGILENPDIIGLRLKAIGVLSQMPEKTIKSKRKPKPIDKEDELERKRECSRIWYQNNKKNHIKNVKVYREEKKEELKIYAKKYEKQMSDDVKEKKRIYWRNWKKNRKSKGGE